jgi:hypothetical protein
VIDPASYIPAPGEFKTDPYRHQLKAYLRSRDEPYWGVLFEQRCGKSKVLLDTAAYNYRLGKISALLVIAPNGVNYNWVTEEIPFHLPEDTNYRTLLWRSGHMETKRALTERALFLAHEGLIVLSVNIDALITAPLRAFLTQLFRERRVMSAVDESLDIAGRGAKRTDIALKIGQRSVIRRILDGTPMAAGPLGLWTQGEFLLRTKRAVRHGSVYRPPVPGAWGFSSFTAFRSRYAKMGVRDVGERDKRCPDCGGNSPDAYPPCKRCNGSGYVGRKEIPQVEEWRDLDDLALRLASFSSRVLRSECVDLPPKVYRKAFFELTPEARRVYGQMREASITELKTGGIVTAAIVLTKLLRLQQITSNFLPVGGDPEPCPDCFMEGCERCDFTGSLAAIPPVLKAVDTKDPRLEIALAELTALGDRQGIVWARFRWDVDALCGAMDRLGYSYVRYDGSTEPAERERAKMIFRAGEAQYFIGNPHAAGRGLDLSAADFTMYYSHSWSLRTRLQSEDRMISLKESGSTGKLVIDIVAEGAVDEKVLTALRKGKSLSDEVTGDPSYEWL